MLSALEDRLAEEGWAAELLTSRVLLVRVVDREDYSILLEDYKRITRELKGSSKKITNDKLFE